MIPSDERFNMDESFDKSKYLTKVKHVPGRQFGSYAARTDRLLKQGGDQTVQLSGRCQHYYTQE